MRYTIQTLTMHTSKSQTLKPQYGIDGPLVIKQLAISALVAFFAGAIFSHFSVKPSPTILPLLLYGILCSSGCWLAIILMFFSSLYGKYRMRDQLINTLSLQGHEKILDVGCGRGLLLIAATKQLKSGKAIGIDLWSQDDLSNNNATSTNRNAELENVADKIELVTGDMTNMTFKDNTFDVIISSMAVHNLPSKAAREKAIQEINRVLKPGGRIALLDFIHIPDYQKTLYKLGWRNTKITTGME